MYSIKLEVGSGSGSASKWKIGSESGYGSALKTMPIYTTEKNQRCHFIRDRTYIRTRNFSTDEKNKKKFTIPLLSYR